MDKWLFGQFKWPRSEAGHSAESSPVYGRSDSAALKWTAGKDQLRDGCASWEPEIGKEGSAMSSKGTYSFHPMRRNLGTFSIYSWNDLSTVGPFPSPLSQMTYLYIPRRRHPTRNSEIRNTIMTDILHLVRLMYYAFRSHQWFCILSKEHRCIVCVVDGRSRDWRFKIWSRKRAIDSKTYYTVIK